MTTPPFTPNSAQIHPHNPSFSPHVGSNQILEWHSIPSHSNDNTKNHNTSMNAHAHTLREVVCEYITDRQPATTRATHMVPREVPRFRRNVIPISKFTTIEVKEYPSQHQHRRGGGKKAKEKGKGKGNDTDQHQTYFRCNWEQRPPDAESYPSRRYFEYITVTCS